MSKINENVVLKLYLDQGESVRAIAEQLNTYPNKIRRLLKKLGVKIKNHSEVQKELIKSGKVKHPTEGTKRSAETKTKISEKRAAAWEAGGQEAKDKQAEVFRGYWQGLTPDKQAEIFKLANSARHKASRVGSKFEFYVGEYLKKHGLQVIVHKKGMIINPDLEIDILLPTEKIALEIDGPTHYLPIHGQDHLDKQQKADNEKNGLLLNAGFVVIRFKHVTKTVSQKYKRDASAQILEVIKEINKQFPPVGQRLIYI